MKRRIIYIVNWRVQLKIAVLIIIPILVFGFFAVTVGYKLSQGMIAVQRQQLMLQIASIEESIKNFEGYLLDKVAAGEVLDGIRRLKIFVQDLIAVNIYELMQLTRMIAVVGFVLIAGSLIFGLIISHRIAGPIYRLEKLVRQLAKGQDTGTIRTRATDEFQSFAGALELLRKRIFDRSSEQKILVRRMREKTDTIKEKAKSGAVTVHDCENLLNEVSDLEKTC